jgi:hypothetical protein
MAATRRGVHAAVAVSDALFVCAGERIEIE